MSKKNKLEDFRDHVDAKRQHEVDAKIMRINEDRGRINRKYKDLHEDYLKIKNELDLINSICLDNVGPVQIKPLIKGNGSESYPIMVASDWHVFERVDFDQVNGLNRYNRKIAEKSVVAFFQGGLDWIKIHRSGTNIPAMGLAFLGDIMTGMLHADQAESNEGTPQEEILFALDLMTGGINFLLEEGGFERMDVYCSDGNHGRDTDKIRKSNRVKHSHEWLLYQFLARWFKDDDRVNFHISTGYLNYATIYGKTIRMHHGDAVRYMGGIGGLSIPMNKAISQWDKANRSELDIFGHFHQFMNHNKFISNGSILGYSPYALSIKASYETPMQSMALINNKRFLTSVDRIYVR